MLHGKIRSYSDICFRLYEYFNYQLYSYMKRKKMSHKYISLPLNIFAGCGNVYIQLVVFLATLEAQNIDMVYNQKFHYHTNI